MIAVVILTCDRFDMTKKTVESFLKHNNKSNFKLFYGDDASKDDSVHDFMKSHGITCVMKHTKRMGCSPSSQELVCEVVKKSDAPFILYLQNDFETIRPIPIQVVQNVMKTKPQVGWIRLYGKNKNNTIPGGNPTNPTHKFKPGQPLVVWEPFAVDSEGLEIGDIHWSYHPAISRRDIILKILSGVKSESDAAKNAVTTQCLTARFMNNITNHIGIRKTTPGGLFGKNGTTY